MYYKMDLKQSKLLKEMKSHSHLHKNEKIYKSIYRAITDIVYYTSRGGNLWYPSELKLTPE
jgi:hypothetical protein